MNDLDKIIKFKPTGIKLSKGSLLVSEPLIQDVIFRRAVLLLAEHDDEGSFGLILNKPSTAKVSDLVSSFGKCDFPVYIGGPVDADQLFILHTEGSISESYEVLDGVYWGGNMEDIQLGVFSGRLHQNNFRCFLGYSGWTAKQLLTEIDENSWLVSESSLKDIFDENPENLWTSILNRYGNSYKHWINIPVNPEMN